MRRLFQLLLSVVLLTTAGFASSALAQERQIDPNMDRGDRSIPQDDEIIPKVIHRINLRGADNFDQVGADAKGIGLAAPTGGTGAVGPLRYHNGPLLNSPTVYVVFYGNWNQTNGSDTAAGQQLIRDYLRNAGGSPYFKLNTTLSVAGHSISGSFTYGGDTTDTGSQGTSLSDSRVLAAITNAISTGKLPNDSNGFYFLISSTNIAETSGFCSQYCGFHTASSTSVGHVRWSFVGNANRCLNGCAVQTTSPNGNAGIDASISVISHELAEGITDPDAGNGWFSSAGAENGDLCNFTFGHAQFQTSNGSFANLTVGGKNYLVQRLVSHTSSSDHCMMSSTQN